MILQLKKHDKLIVPTQAREGDAGYDVVSISEPKIVGIQGEGGCWSSVDFIEYETGIFIYPKPQDLRDIGSFHFDNVEQFKNFEKNQRWLHFHTLAHPRSSVSKYNLILANSIGLIDEGYRAQVLVRFKYIWQPMDFRLKMPLTSHVPRIFGAIDFNKIYRKGDKICQLKVAETIPIQFELVDELPESQRGKNGFGSTGK